VPPLLAVLAVQLAVRLRQFTQQHGTHPVVYPLVEGKAQ
jgi:hypothetical protein